MSIKDYNFHLAISARTDITGPIRSLRLMSSNGTVTLDVNNSKSALVAGRAVIFDRPVENISIINETAAAIDGVLSLGASATISDNILSGTVGVVKSSTLGTLMDVSLVAIATTLIVAADATRNAAIISNLTGNISIIRTGDISAGAARGNEVGPGQSITLEGSAAIYAYSPTLQSVGITVIKD